MATFWYHDKINTHTQIVISNNLLRNLLYCNFFSSPCRYYYLTITHLSAADQVNVGTRSFDEDQYCPAATCALSTSLLSSIQRYRGTFLQTFIALQSNTGTQQYTPTQTCSVAPFTLHLLLQICKNCFMYRCLCQGQCIFVSFTRLHLSAHFC